MTASTFFTVSPSGFKTLESGVGHERATAREIKYFLRWCRSKGFRIVHPAKKRCFRGESIKRYCHVHGTGEYEGLTMHVINRMSVHKDLLGEEALQKRAERGRLSYVSHREDGCSVHEGAIACFNGHYNVFGYHGITWRDIIDGDYHMLMQLRPKMALVPRIGKAF